MRLQDYKEPLYIYLTTKLNCVSGVVQLNLLELYLIIELWCTIAGALPLLQSSLQKVELEDEVDLVYAVVTLPAGDDTSAYLFFLDDKTGNVLKKTEITTWKQVKCNSEVKELSLIEVYSKLLYSLTTGNG